MGPAFAWAMAGAASAHQAATATREDTSQQRAGRTRRTSADPQRAQQGATASPAAAPAAGNSLSRLQQLAVASPQVAQLQRLQALAHASPQVARLQALADRHYAPVSQLAGAPEEAELIQGQFASAELAPQLQQAPRANNTGLPDQLKSGIESLSGLSMDPVRVHYNSSQPAQLNALAYAQGSDIHVAPGQEQHLPHEAWHVVQQAQGRVKPTMQMKDGVPVNDDVGLEHEADVMGSKAVDGAVQATGHYARPEPNPGLPGMTNAPHVVQRTPADFNNARVLAIAAKTGAFRTSYWSSLRSAVASYSNAAEGDMKTRKRLLLEIGTFTHRWEKARGLPETPVSELDSAEQQKVAALEELKILLFWENRELIGIEQRSGELDTGPVVPSLDLGSLVTAAPEPRLTAVREEKDERQRGYFTEDIRIVDDGNQPLDEVHAHSLCRVMKKSGGPAGQDPEHYFWARPAPSDDRVVGTVEAFRPGWIKKNKVLTENLERDVSKALVYEDKFDPLLFPLFQGTPSVEDVAQVNLGNCWLEAAVMALVRRNPSFFIEAMKDHGNGVVSVRLFEKNAGGVSPPFVPKIIHVRKSVVVENQKKLTYSEGYNKGMLWVQLLEKAYAAAGFYGRTADTLPTRNPSWSQIASGNADIAFAHLTGKISDRTEIASKGPDEATEDLNWTQRGRVRSAIHEKDPALLAEWNGLKKGISAELMKLEKAVDVVRIDDVLTMLEQKIVNSKLREAVIDFLNKNNFYPGKRGLGQYTDQQRDVFQKIVDAVNAKKPAVLGSRSYIKRKNRNREGQSGGENVYAGLAGPHGYELIDYQPKPYKPEMRSTVFWVKVRNPWGKTGRKYMDKFKPGEQIGPERYDLFRAKATKQDDPEFWMPLADVTKRFTSLIVME